MLREDFIPYVRIALFSIALAVLAAASGLNVSLLAPVIRNQQNVQALPSYIPESFTLFPLEQHTWTSSMITEESCHYTPDDAGFAEWMALLPRGQSFVRLGPDGESYAVGMYHQMTCLQIVQTGLHKAHPTLQEREKISSCFNYLRQTFLCAASVKLEPFRPSRLDGGSDAVNGLGFVHTCRDWTRVRRLVEENHDRWNAHDREDTKDR